MRSDGTATVHARAYLQSHDRLTLSIITRYEILRGLKAKRASVQLAAFERFCQASEVLPLTDEIIQRASDIYAGLHQTGRPIGDADILIAATALVHGFVLVTNNTDHYLRIEGLSLDNWLRS